MKILHRVLLLILIYHLEDLELNADILKKTNLPPAVQDAMHKDIDGLTETTLSIAVNAYANAS